MITAVGLVYETKRKKMYKVIIEHGSKRWVRMIRATSLDHAREQAKIIEGVLINEGVNR